MEEFAQQKLNEVATAYADEWKWTEAQIEFTWLDQQNHLVADADARAEFADAETACSSRPRSASRRRAGSSTRSTARSTPQGRRELLSIVTREQNGYAEIERARVDRDTYSETVRAHAGVVVALDRDGNPDIHRGLVRA